MSLESIRETKKNTGTKIIIGLLLLGMAGFGTSQFNQQNNEPNSVLTLGDESVSQYTLDQWEARIRSSNPNLDSTQVRKTALDILAKDLAVTQYIKKYPFAESSNVVAESIRNNRQFFTGGKFDKDYYQSQVDNVEAYERNIAKETATRGFQQALIDTAIVNEIELAPYLAMANIKRDIQFVTLKKADYKATVNDAEISTYYNENKDKFKTTEQINVQYIDLNLAEFAKSYQISEADKAQAYETYLSTEKSKEARRASYLLFEKETEAEQAHTLLTDKQQSFTEVTTAVQDKLLDSGDLGEASKGQGALPELDEAIFALDSIGAVSQPIKTSDGYFIVKLESISSNIKEKSAMLDELETLARTQKAELEFAPLSEKFEKLIFDTELPTSLADISKELGIPIAETGLIKITNRQGILGINEVSSVLFAEKKPELNKLQEPVSLNDSKRLIAYQLSENVLPVEQDLATIKSEVEAQLISETSSKKLDTAAQSFIDKVKKESLATIAATDGLTVTEIKDLTQETEDNNLDLLAKFQILQQPTQLGDKNISKVNSISGDAIIYITSKIALGNGSDEASKKQIEEAIPVRVGQQELQGFLDSVTARAGIKQGNVLTVKTN